MKRTALVLVIVLASAAFAAPVRADFKRIVRGIEREGNIRHRWIPMLSVARLAVRLNPVEGVSDFRLAVFDRNPLPAERLDSLVRESVSKGWSPMVGVRERNGSQARIYMREVGENVSLLIVASEDEELVVMQLRIDPEKLAEMIDEEGDLHTPDVSW